MLFPFSQKITVILAKKHTVELFYGRFFGISMMYGGEGMFVLYRTRFLRNRFIRN